ncbi:hypothetical protein [Reticulibacter mediterranei]|uniref:hypothetical protein n=1 Tax=Reticulibacter mediterranei TaxID=2778369 RepID=UPI001C68D025|nr:hypothetical protein [Reticulibacter mediterranei]
MRIYRERAIDYAVWWCGRDGESAPAIRPGRPLHPGWWVSEEGRGEARPTALCFPRSLPEAEASVVVDDHVAGRLEDASAARPVGDDPAARLENTAIACGCGGLDDGPGLASCDITRQRADHSIDLELLLCEPEGDRATLDVLSDGGLLGDGDDNPHPIGVADHFDAERQVADIELDVDVTVVVDGLDHDDGQTIALDLKLVTGGGECDLAFGGDLALGHWCSFGTLRVVHLRSSVGLTFSVPNLSWTSAHNLAGQGCSYRICLR